MRAGIKNQNLMLFTHGKAIPAAPNIKGTNQLPKPPIKIGITMKKNYNKRMNTSPHLSMLSPSLFWGGSAGLPKGPTKPPNIAQVHGAILQCWTEPHFRHHILLFLECEQHCICPF
jgi:hypothetical protein